MLLVRRNQLLVIIVIKSTRLLFGIVCRQSLLSYSVRNVPQPNFLPTEPFANPKFICLPLSVYSYIHQCMRWIEHSSVRFEFDIDLESPSFNTVFI